MSLRAFKESAAISFYLSFLIAHYLLLITVFKSKVCLSFNNYFSKKEGFFQPFIEYI